jgi:hypothetical protein
MLHRHPLRVKATKLPRRRFLHLAVGAAALPTTMRIVRAQAYPTRPVRIVVGFTAGGSTDIAARLMGQWLSERLGQPFIVENRPGAAGNIGTEAVVRAPADGHTILMCASSNAINATLYGKLNFNFIRDIAPVAGISRAPYVIVVNPSFPATTVAEFIAYAKANLGKVNMASAGCRVRGCHAEGQRGEGSSTACRRRRRMTSRCRRRKSEGTYAARVRGEAKPKPRNETRLPIGAASLSIPTCNASNRRARGKVGTALPQRARPRSPPTPPGPKRSGPISTANRGLSVSAAAAPRIILLIVAVGTLLPLAAPFRRMKRGRHGSAAPSLHGDVPNNGHSRSGKFCTTDVNGFRRAKCPGPRPIWRSGRHRPVLATYCRLPHDVGAAFSSNMAAHPSIAGASEAPWWAKAKVRRFHTSHRCCLTSPYTVFHRHLGTPRDVPFHFACVRPSCLASEFQRTTA